MCWQDGRHDMWTWRYFNITNIHWDRLTFTYDLWRLSLPQVVRCMAVCIAACLNHVLLSTVCFFLCGQIKADIISVLRRHHSLRLTWPMTFMRPDWYFYKKTGIDFRLRRQTHIIAIVILSVCLLYTRKSPLMVSCIEIHCAIYDKVRFLWF